MEAQVNDNLQSNVNDMKDKRKGYNKKLSAKLYKRFSLLTFFIYYLNCMVRIITRTASFYNSKGIVGFSPWWKYASDLSNWKEISEQVFDWYTIALVTFLLLYAVVFLFTFIRFSPKNKKTFKYFKKGFLMARRVIKMVNLALSITVLINSAQSQLLTFVDKFLFVISLSSLVITFFQLCMSITTWIIGRKFRKNNTSIKAYMGRMGNVVSSYVLNSRLRPEEVARTDGKISIGDKLSSMRSRFLHTVEALTYSEEARESDRKYSGENLSPSINNTDRFENDYIEVSADVELDVPTTGRHKHSARLKMKSEKVKEPKVKETKIKEKKVKDKDKDKENLQSKKSSVSKRRSVKILPEQKSEETTQIVEEENNE